ncbi:MAG: NYN domain-containing protein, partial [Albidovulum sp.]
MIQEWIRHSVESKPRSGVAVLVDGENISQDLAGQIINRASALGPLVVKRVYGNAAKMPKWEAAPGFRLAHSGAGKNATDLLLAIEAVSLFHEGSIDTVVIASSDRDFSHLAHHLRERQLSVVGMGAAHAPDTFRKACSKFMELAAPEFAECPITTKP